jgi:seryl-tRNA synthetase
MIAILENNQEADGSVRLPSPLRAFMGQTHIRPRAAKA